MERAEGVTGASLSAEEERAAIREEECRRLLDVLRGTGVVSERRYARSEVVYRSEEEGGALYVIMGGAMRLLGSYPGHAGSKRATLGIFGPWEVLGYPILSRGPPRYAIAEAMTDDCVVVKVPRVFVERALRREPSAALAVMTLLEFRLVEQEAFVECILPRASDARIAKLLLLLAGKFGERSAEPGGRTSIGLRLTRQDLAEMVATTRESATAVVMRLREGGLVEMERGRIVLLDPVGLAEMARR